MDTVYMVEMWNWDFTRVMIRRFAKNMKTVRCIIDDLNEKYGACAFRQVVMRKLEDWETVLVEKGCVEG